MVKSYKPKKKKPLPRSARKVFSGIIFDAYQWQQELYDGSMATFERLKRPDTAATIAITEDKDILMVRETQPDREESVSLPGGRVDPGESPVEAAKRELREETGYEVTSEPIHLIETEVSPKIDWHTHIFIARNCQQIGGPQLDAGEKIQVFMASWDEFLEFASSLDCPHVELNRVVLHHYKIGSIDKLHKLIMGER